MTNTELRDEIAEIHARIAARAVKAEAEWEAAQPKFITEDLLIVPPVRPELSGLTFSIEREASGVRVVAERRDGVLVNVHQVERNHIDSLLVDAAAFMAVKFTRPERGVFLRDVLRLPPCPSFCREAHYYPDEDHFGGGFEVEAVNLREPAFFSLEQCSGDGEVVVTYMISASEPDDLCGHKFTADQIRVMRDGLTSLLAVLDAQEEQ